MSDLPVHWRRFLCSGNLSYGSVSRTGFHKEVYEKVKFSEKVTGVYPLEADSFTFSFSITRCKTIECILINLKVYTPKNYFFRVPIKRALKKWRSVVGQGCPTYEKSTFLLP
ncbi:MAG: hypothetical protein A2W07_01715 [candidate division Zixibacteria bacterium RBG_16_43_9]|nr:MAG: hypothetical protein A2W07_01715 [candidate division Zixibacteria bacterium RBG_16_43_9]